MADQIRTRLAARLAPFLVIAALQFTGCTGTTDPSEDDSLTGLDLFLPAEIVSGRPFEMTIEALGRGAPGFSGDVVLDVRGAAIDEPLVALVDGTATVTRTLSGPGDPVTITARAAGVSGLVEIPALFQAALPGDPADPAMGALPSLRFTPRPQDYSDDNPDLGGMVSFNTVTVVFRAEATVGEVNALLSELGGMVVGHVSGDGVVPGLMTLRLPVTSHEDMNAVVAGLRANDLVASSAVDALVRTEMITGYNGGAPDGWEWDPIPGGGNWGLERARVPQMWNLRPALLKRSAVPSVVTAVMDNGFPWIHADDELDLIRHDSVPVNDHGSHVAGIIAAAFDNGVGVDGVNPFASLVVTSPPNCGDSSECSFSRAWRNSELEGLVKDFPDLRVVNASLGRHWHGGDNPYNPGDSDADQIYYAHIGLEFAALALLLEELYHMPMIVNSAGNSSGGGIGLVDAKYNTDYAYAGLVYGVDAVVVVEAAENDLGNGTSYEVKRAAFSNINGDISAPGAGILSTAASEPYQTKSGTSMAAPFIAGVIGYLYAVAPDLTHDQIRELLFANAKLTVGGGSDCVDAFASVMDIDRVRGDDRVLRMLLDVDDGTEDGNLRKAYGSAEDYLGTDFDGDGGPGDGVIDMADFRCWRDAFLFTHADDNTFLDGSAQHPKKDLNGDHVVGNDEGENLYPRCDFNGDGAIEDSTRAYLPGRIQASVTDLEALQRLFDDPHYQAEDLPGLIESGDIAVDGSVFLALFGADRAEVEVRRSDDGQLVETRDLPAENPVQVLTVPWSLSGYDLTARVWDGAGELLAEAATTLGLLKGEDKYWRPSDRELVVEIDIASTVSPEGANPLTVRAGHREAGTITWEPDLEVTLQVNGGSADPTSGTTDQDGEFISVMTPDPGAEEVVILAGVTDDEGVTATTTAYVQVSVDDDLVLPGGRITTEFRLSIESYESGDYDSANGSDLIFISGFGDNEAAVDSSIAIGSLNANISTNTRASLLRSDGQVSLSVNTSYDAAVAWPAVDDDALASCESECHVGLEIIGAHTVTVRGELSTSTAGDNASAYVTAHVGPDSTLAGWSLPGGGTWALSQDDGGTLPIAETTADIPDGRHRLWLNVRGEARASDDSGNIGSGGAFASSRVGGLLITLTPRDAANAQVRILAGPSKRTGRM